MKSIDQILLRLDELSRGFNVQIGGSSTEATMRPMVLAEVSASSSVLSGAAGPLPLPQKIYLGRGVPSTLVHLPKLRVGCKLTHRATGAAKHSWIRHMWGWQHGQQLDRELRHYSAAARSGTTGIPTIGFAIPTKIPGVPRYVQSKGAGRCTLRAVMWAHVRYYGNRWWPWRQTSFWCATVPVPCHPVDLSEEGVDDYVYNLVAISSLVHLLLLTLIFDMFALI